MAAVVLGGHDLAISAGGTKGDQVATMSLIQLYILTEYIRRLTDRAHYIVSLYCLIAADVLDTVISVVHRRADQFRETCIKDSEFLRLSFLDI